MRRTILSLSLCALRALQTAAAIALLSSRRAARDREDDALDEVARLQLRIVEATADYEVERDMLNGALDLLTQARAAANACYETGWAAVVERDEAYALNANMLAHCEGHVAEKALLRARAEAAEKARDEAVAELEAQGIARAAVVPVACLMCDKAATEHMFAADGSRIELCAPCIVNRKITTAMIDERHAASEQAKATAEAPVVEPVPCGMPGCEVLHYGSHPVAGPAPTQDDSDDAAVRALLERGPATWWEIQETVDGSRGRARAVIVRLSARIVGDRGGNAIFATAPEATS